MYELIKKTFEIEILGEIIEYPQLSYYDCLELKYEIENGLDMYDWAYTFLSDKMTVTKKDIEKLDVPKLFDIYLDTACRGFYDTGKKKGDGSPISAFFAFLAKESKTDMLSLIKSYTPEALNFMAEGIVYNLNEQTKEGQKRNKLNAIKKTKTDDDDFLERVKEMRAKKSNQ